MPGSVNISVRISTYERLCKAKNQHTSQCNKSWNDFINELLDATTCQLCGKPSGGEHKECMDREAMLSDQKKEE